ncbi:MAG: phosphopantetheine-binding protein [Bacteroidales bacterium]|jgi:acyl carrier protein|nr:phosphopantetheine-binding protein [Bacteroidales bacterium]
MDKQEIIIKINNFLIDEFELEESQLQPTASLKETLEIDSLDYVDLVVIIEKNFGFKVKGGDFATIKTLQDFYDYIIKHANSN